MWGGGGADEERAARGAVAEDAEAEPVAARLAHAPRGGVERQRRPLPQRAAAARGARARARGAREAPAAEDGGEE